MYFNSSELLKFPAGWLLQQSRLNGKLSLARVLAERLWISRRRLVKNELRALSAFGKNLTAKMPWQPFGRNRHSSTAERSNNIAWGKARFLRGAPGVEIPPQSKPRQGFHNFFAKNALCPALFYGTAVSRVSTFSERCGRVLPRLCRLSLAARLASPMLASFFSFEAAPRLSQPAPVHLIASYKYRFAFTRSSFPVSNT